MNLQTVKTELQEYIIDNLKDINKDELLSRGQDVNELHQELKNTRLEMKQKIVYLT